MAEGRRIDRLRPQHRVGVPAFDGVVRHREVRVQHLAHDRRRAALLAQALVVDDVRLHQRDPQRLAGDRRRRGQRRDAVAREQQRDGRGKRQRPHHRTPAVAAPCDGRGEARIGEQQPEGQAGGADQVGRLAQQA